MADQKLDALYCYTRKELADANPMQRMLYLENRFKLPRAQANQPGYAGPFSASLARQSDASIQWIWDKYQEEGLAGKKALSKKAPRDPSLNPEPEEEYETPPEEERKPELEPGPEPEPTVTIPDVAEISDEKPRRGRPPGRKSVEKPPVATGVEAGIVSFPAMPDFSDEFKEVKDIGKMILALQDANAQQLKSIASEIASVWENLSNLVSSQHSLTIVIGDLIGNFMGYEDLKSDYETVARHVHTSLVYTSPQAQQEILQRHEEEVDGVGVESDNSDGPVIDVSDWEEDDSGGEVIPIRGAPSAGFRVEDNSICLKIEGQEHNFRLSDLLDSQKYPLELLRKIGTALGVDLQSVSDRVMAIHLIMDTVTPKTRH